MVFNSSKPIICISITLITYQFLDVTLCPTRFFKVYNIKILLVFRMTSFPFGLIYKNYLYFLPSWLLTRTGFPLLRITYSISCYYLLLRAACQTVCYLFCLFHCNAYHVRWFEKLISNNTILQQKAQGKYNDFKIPPISSNVNNDIKTILSQCIFFHKKILHAQKHSQGKIN